MVSRSTFHNNQQFSSITSSLSENELIIFSNILSAIKPTPELTGLKFIVIRLLDCCQIAKKIKWPQQLQISLDSQIKLLNKIISNKNFNKPRVFPSANPIYRRFLEFPVSALYCQSFSSSLSVDQQESLLFIQHLIFLLLVEGKSDDELIKNGCNELRKLISAESLFEKAFPFEKLDNKILPRIFDLLIENGKISFQRQLSTAWREFINDELKIATIPTPLKEPQKISAKNTTHLPSSLSNKSRSKTNNHRGYTTTKKINYTPVRSASVEIDNALIETVELNTKEGVELDRRTKQAHILSQNRLSLVEQKHLAWRSNALAEHEERELVIYLKNQLNAPNPNAIVIYATLLLITSKSFDLLSDFLITDKLSSFEDTENIIELSTETWWQKCIKMPESFSPTGIQKEFLYPHKEWLALPLPVELLTALKQLKITNGQRLADICGIHSPSTQLSEFLNEFWHPSKQIFRRITPASLRSAFFEKVTRKFNAGYACLLLANSEYHSPTVLYYLSDKASKLQDNYKKILQEFEFSVRDLLPATDYYVGSELAINIELFKNVLTKKINTLINIPDHQNIDDLIRYHNNFANYLTLMLLASTGHRIRNEYGFCDFTIDDQLGYIILADKINYVDSAIRIIPLPDLVIEQIKSYRNHCALLSRKLSKFDKISQALAAVQTKQIYNSPFLFHIGETDIQVIGNQQIDDYLSPEITLPVNFLRHYFCSALGQNQHYDFTSSFMGHVGNGTHILADFSCLKLSDIKSAKPAIDSALSDLGFGLITVKTPKGKLVSATGKIGEYYQPGYLCRSENKEVKAQIKWARKLILPYAEQLRHAEQRDKTIKKIDELVRSDNHHNISLERRLYWINRWLYKLTKNNRWISTRNQEHTLHIESNLLVVMNEAEKITAEINRWLISTEDKSSKIEWISKLWLSLSINSHFNQPLSKKILAIIQSPPQRHVDTGIVWYQVGTKTSPQYIYLDSVTQVLCFNRAEWQDLEVSVDDINRYLKKTTLLKIRNSVSLCQTTKQTLSSTYKLVNFLQSARHQHRISLLDAHRAKRITTTSLSPKHMIRWLSKGSLKIERGADNKLTTPPAYIKSTVLNNGTDLFCSSLNLINKLHKALHQLIENKITSKITTEKLIITLWAEHVGCQGKTDLSDLINSSTNIDNVMVLILVWLVDVSKRPGKENRTHTAPSTVKTYLSNVGKPLLEQTIEENFLALDADELTELYINALDARAVKDRAQRASAFRQFHNFNKELFALESIDWYEVEPSIDQQKQSVNANIISMTEYENALALLDDDNCFSMREKRLNKILLILCYRAGLRSGETTHLKTSDLDTNNWILHVRTHGNHRLKTLRSNRRIPLNSLLSSDEKDLISAQLKDAQLNLTEGENNWLFNDLNNSQCLVDRYKHIQRVTEALKISTGDNTMRLHNARHSFANYLLLTIVELNYPKIIKDELKHWTRSSNFNSFRKDLSAMYLSSSENKQNALYAVSVAMGHSTPKTTLNSYIHSLDIMLHAQQEGDLFEQVNIPELAKRVKIKRTSTNKILQRGGAKQYGMKPLIERISFLDGDFKNVVLPKRDTLELSDLTLNKVSDRYNHLNNIERIIRATEDNNSIIDIMNMYQLSHDEIQSTIDATLQIKQLTAYYGTSISSSSQYLFFSNNQQKTETASHYIHQDEFQNLLKKISKLTDEELCYLSGIFINSFDKTHGMVISTDDTSELTLIAKQLNYKAVIAKKLTLLRSKYGVRKGNHIKFIAEASSKKNYSREIYSDNRFTHSLFLTAVLTTSTSQLIGNKNEYKN